jgi:hypothetical protein
MASAKGARYAAMYGQTALDDSEKRVLGELEKGYTGAQGYLGQAKDLFGGMTTQGQAGLDRYLSLLSGDQSALEGTAGYQFAMDQGLQALNRRRAAGGMLNSGNADADAIKFASGLASQTLNQERQAALPLMQLYSQGISGQAGSLGSLADLDMGYFGSRAGIMDQNDKDKLGLVVGALKAGDAAKAQNQANMLGAITGGLNLLGSGLGSGGFFTRLLG